VTETVDGNRAGSYTRKRPGKWVMRMVEDQGGQATELLRHWTEGDQKALDELLPLVYKELRRWRTIICKPSRCAMAYCTNGGSRCVPGECLLWPFSWRSFLGGGPCRFQAEKLMLFF
jgi:hypothetical protein